MRRASFSIVAGLLVALASVAAFAQSQTAAPMVPGYYSTQGCAVVTTCFQPQLKPIVGTQRGVSVASATALTIPTGATLAIITVQGTNNSSGICAYWQDDGTDPTASAGQPVSALTTIRYFIKSLPIKLITATGATCSISVSYYG